MAARAAERVCVYRSGPALPPCADLIESDRPVVPNIHTDIDLSRQAGELAVAVTVEIVGALVHAVPGAERIVAEHQPRLFQLHLAICLHAGPPGQAHRLGAVVIAGHEVLDTVEALKNDRHPLSPHPIGKIAEMPDLVAGADAIIPTCNQRLVHLADGAERPLEAPERAAMAEMRVSREPDRQTGISYQLRPRHDG